MTPDAVIYRYLEIVTPAHCDFDQLCLLLSADADLLTRWLKLLGVAADYKTLQQRIADLDSQEFQGLSQAQAWSVLPIVGSARLSLDQWQSVLRAACLAQVLAEHIQQHGSPLPQASIDDDLRNVRLRALLAISGVHLDSDPMLTQLIEFRGINPALLEDASPELRIFAVIDALEVGRDVELAQQLLGIGADRFAELLKDAEQAANQIVTQLAIELDDEADWAHRIWLRQQIAIVTDGMSACADWASLQVLHNLVSRCLFPKPPLIFVSGDEDKLLVALGPYELAVNLDSRTSQLAACVRNGHALQITDSADLAVVDRQILRALGSDEVFIVPLPDVAAALVVGTDEDNDIESAAKLYAQALSVQALRLAQPTEPEPPVQTALLEQFRSSEYKRLREIVHEANNPLSIVHNYLHILELRLQHEPEAVEQLTLIASELRRAGEIFTRAREVPQLTEVEVTTPGEISEIDLTAWALRLIELHRGYAADRRVDLSSKLPQHAVKFATQPDKLTQIITNLLKNAIEACSGDDEVRLGLYSGVYRDGYQGIEIYVEDTGPGLAPEILQDLSGEKVSSKGGEHQGIGLQVAFRLTAELGGALDVRTAQGEGTTFSLFLPRSNGT